MKESLVITKIRRIRIHSRNEQFKVVIMNNVINIRNFKMLNEIGLC